MRTFYQRIQLQMEQDHELRNVCIFFAKAFVLLFVSGILWFGLGLLAFLAVTPYAYWHSKKNGLPYQVTVQGAFLGSAAGFSLACTIANYGETIEHLPRYFLFLSSFHFTEYLFTALTNRRSLQPDSFLLNHSVGYWIAASISWLEFLIEAYFIPSIKIRSIMLIGTIGCIIGELFRKLAMVHAGVGFTHRLAMTKRLDHKLVKEGVYAIMRHPGYFGWFLWAVSTQIILCNPICLVVYGFVTWQFFSQRIYDEEKDLVQFFGDSYLNYQENVWVGVPFVTGYQLP